MKAKEQTVTVPLKAVLDLQAEYIRLSTEVKKVQVETSIAAAKDNNNFVRGMEKVIRQLGLPIALRG